MTAETTLRLAHASDKFIAVKEASDDIYQIMKIIKGRPEGFLVLSGDDFMTLPVISTGGDGVISVIANCSPRPFTDMVRAALRDDMPTARQLNLQLLVICINNFSQKETRLVSRRLWKSGAFARGRSGCRWFP
jgi:4-hydroxy-tetrahydrodipicolinate synthase